MSLEHLVMPESKEELKEEGTKGGQSPKDQELPRAKPGTTEATK